MIDTIKIYTMIDLKTFNKINSKSVLRTCIDKSTGDIVYEINSNSLVGSYSSSVNIRTGDGSVYGFVDKKFLSIEGSYHKIMLGYNSHNGFYDLKEIVKFFISSVEYKCDVKLPSFNHWFLQRIDISVVYDLKDNDNVKKYINNLSFCNYARRNIKHYQDESIYCSGTTTTLKIYNKLLEFKKHDMKRLFKYNFDIDNYLLEIAGFVRFECEIKKKKLEEIYCKKYIRIKNTNYEDFYNLWKEEFMKLLKFFESDLTIVRNKDEIERRLYTIYPKRRANTLYTFYCSLMLDGVNNVKNRVPSSTYRRNIKYLKEANIDLSQRYKLDLENDIVNFNPFECEAVL